jgi:hypothetical protein
MDVEVDLYSGRPNPRFQLDAAAAAELLQRLSVLRQSVGSAASREGLGYRGLRIDAGADDAPIAQILVSGGSVLVREQTGRERGLHDSGRALELWLIDIGERFLDPATIAMLRNG